MRIKDKITGEIIGKVTTNQSLTLDQAMVLIGYPWVESDNKSGYKVGDVYYDEGSLEMDYADDAARALASIRSPARATASRINGRKGGRPRIKNPKASPSV